ALHPDVHARGKDTSCERRQARRFLNKPVRNDRKPPSCFVSPAGAADAGADALDDVALDDAALDDAACEALAAAGCAELGAEPGATPACFALCSEIASISSGDSTS